MTLDSVWDCMGNVTYKRSFVTAGETANIIIFN